MADSGARATPPDRELPTGGGAAPAGRGELVMLALLTVLGLGLRLAGAAALGWDADESPPAAEGWRDWLGATPLSARVVALALGSATVPIAYLLLRPQGTAPALVLALLVAASPWHVHASRFAGPAAATFLALLLVCRALRIGGSGVRTFDAESRIGLFLLAAAAIHWIAPGPAREWPGARFEIATLVAGELGVALPLLALLHFARRGRWLQLPDAILLGGMAALVAAHAGLRIDPVTCLLPPLFVAAAAELGRWMEAARSRRAQLALALLAVVPALPSLLSEQLDGGRYDLAPIARALAGARAGGEPVYASDPALAARVLGVEARPLAELVDSPPPERASFVLLLLDRGAILGGEGLGADFESRLQLVERSGVKRFDLRRYEARLYRRAPGP